MCKPNVNDVNDTFHPMCRVIGCVIGCSLSSVCVVRGVCLWFGFCLCEILQRL